MEERRRDPASVSNRRENCTHDMVVPEQAHDNLQGVQFISLRETGDALTC